MYRARPSVDDIDDDVVNESADDVVGSSKVTLAGHAEGENQSVDKRLLMMKSPEGMEAHAEDG
jgi:hypothetical protein